MELHEAIKLIQNNYIDSSTPQTWADLGCGTGLFTQALASLLHGNSTIHAVDKNIAAFKKFSVEGIAVHKQQFDFITTDIKLENLDGILMANALHYVKDKPAFITKLSNCLKENGLLLFVEYDTDKANPWVPYPVSFAALKELFSSTEYKTIIKLQEHPSVYNRANIYSAIIKR